MPGPYTADERERRFIEYLLTLNKGQIAEVRLGRMNRIANFRKDLMELLNKLIEARAEDLAAAMLMEHAPKRPQHEPAARRRLAERKRAMPPWIREQARALGAKR